MSTVTIQINGFVGLFLAVLEANTATLACNCGLESYSGDVVGDILSAGLEGVSGIAEVEEEMIGSRFGVVVPISREPVTTVVVEEIIGIFIF